MDERDLHDAQDIQQEIKKSKDWRMRCGEKHPDCEHCPVDKRVHCFYHEDGNYSIVIHDRQYIIG